MKKFIFAFMVFASFGVAGEWTDHLILSSQAYDLKDYDLAIRHIDEALLKAPKEEIHRLKIQKASALRQSGKNEEAIVCIEEIENSSKHLSVQQQIDCAENKMMSYARLDNLEKTQECFDILKEIDPRLPKYTHTKTHLIVQNYSLIPNFEKIFKCAMIHTSTAEDSNQIQFHDNGICVIKKMYDCSSCQEFENKPKAFKCDCCGQIITRIEPHLPKRETGCSEGTCRTLEALGSAFCGKHFHSTSCTVACCAIVQAVTQGCIYCCSGGGFYTNCIEPYKHILERCPAYCDPIW